MTSAASAIRIPELLAPAGDWDALRAAIANGADAVYFGLSRFNARHRATNFTPEELPRIMRHLHRRNVRGFVTFNTLIFSDELESAAEYVRLMASSGVDAVIVQDLGLVRLIRAICPELPIHGSTQMTLTEPRGIRRVSEMGVRRVVLARELSLAEIARIRADCQVELEVFCHGALCVAYSGQCLTSESIGGRSANRGQCAQACRLPYDLIVDDSPRDTGELAYLLSPQDLAAYDLVPQLARAGAACLKIEGRLKSAHYVAATTRTYRKSLDALGGSSAPPGPEDRAELEQTFSRGLSHGFLDGVDHQKLVHGRFPKSRGRRIGTVHSVEPQGVIVRVEQGAAVQLQPGDGVVFDEGHPEQDEQGGRVYVVTPAGKGRCRVQFKFGDVNYKAIAPGAIVWKTDDPSLRKRLEQTYSRDEPYRRRPVRAVLRAAEGQRPVLRLEAGRFVAEVEGDEPLPRATRHIVEESGVRAQLGRLGDTPFELASLELSVSGSPIAPRSMLNDLRRRAVEQLLQQMDAAENRPCNEAALGALRAEAAGRKTATGAPQLHVLARDLSQIRALAEFARRGELGVVYSDFEDIRRSREAVSLLRGAGLRAGLATIRIIKPGEEGLLRQVVDCAPDVVLVRNLGAIDAMVEWNVPAELVGDYSLNVTNELTADFYIGSGLKRLVPGYDMSFPQISALLGRFDPGFVECVIHQHMPMFHMEHCVFAHMLSSGKDYRDCGRPCERHRVDLRDRTGLPHPLIPDVGCRNTVYNAQAQSAAEYVPRLLGLGVRHFRVELLRETGEESVELVRRYLGLIRGEESPRSTVRSLRVLERIGVTAGTLEHD